MVKPLPLFERAKPIQDQKCQNLLTLPDYVPPGHHEFDRRLVNCQRVEEDHNVSEDVYREQDLIISLN